MIDWSVRFRKLCLCIEVLRLQVECYYSYLIDIMHVLSKQLFQKSPHFCGFGEGGVEGVWREHKLKCSRSVGRYFNTYSVFSKSQEVRRHLLVRANPMSVGLGPVYSPFNKLIMLIRYLITA